MQQEQKSFRTFEDLEVYQVAREFRMRPATEIPELKDQGGRVYLLTNGYIRYLRERKVGATLALNESSPAYGLTEDELDPVLGTSAMADSTIQRFNGLTI